MNMKQRNYSTSSIINNPTSNSSITRHYSPQGALRLDEENNNVIDITMARLNTSLNNLDIASSSSSSNKMGVGSSFINNIDNNSNILTKNHINNNIKDCQMNENDFDLYQTNNNKKVINITNSNRNNTSFNNDILTINNNSNIDEKKNEDEVIADILIENTNLNDSTTTITSKQSSNKLKTSKLIKMFQPTSNNSDINNNNNNNNNIDLLPPLPSSSTSSSSSTNLSKSSSLNNGSTQSNSSSTSATDFDRNLHLRRSKRYGRQLQQPNNIIIQDININNNDTLISSGSSSEHTSPTTYNSPSPTIVISGLTKAISTPSILDKINNDSNNVKTTTVKINTSEDLISENNNYQNDMNDLVEDTVSSSTSTTSKHSKSVASLVDSCSKTISSNFHSACSTTNLHQAINEDMNNNNNNDSLSKKAAKKAIQTINNYKMINSSSNLTMDSSCNSKKFAQNSSNGGNKHFISLFSLDSIIILFESIFKHKSKKIFTFLFLLQNI